MNCTDVILSKRSQIKRTADHFEIEEQAQLGWGCSLVVEHVLCTYKTLSSIPSAGLRQARLIYGNRGQISDSLGDEVAM